ncbi:MAG: aminotransferase class III-fold pyridoxal phosphate-dependent enzyme [Bacteroidetes bacterium]|nr:aminotransferase class III-fold pyridoxal phosphate-dependent enzyme [Bacteroidota bacterium]
MAIAQPNLMNDAAALCAEAYGLTGRFTELGGHNQNLLLETPEGVQYVLKLAGPEDSSELIDLEHAMAEALHAADVGLAVPRVIPTHTGAVEARYMPPDGELLRGRLLTFVEGTPWNEAGSPTLKRLHNLGGMLAKIHRVLAGVEHPAAHRQHDWDLAKATQLRPLIPLVPDEEKRRLVDRAMHVYAACSVPRLVDLPHGLIHGDANDENTFVDGDRITGLIDFGDALHNPLVCDLAISLAYALFHQPDPLAVGAAIVSGYHAERPLSPDELAVLFPLVLGRLSVTVLIAAEHRTHTPEHPTWYISEGPAWELLAHLVPLDPAESGARFAAQTGLDPLPERDENIDALLEKRRRHINPALSLAYRDPINVVRGQGQYLFDQRGRPYLDLVNNVCHVGHCHPRVVEAGQRQMARLNTNTRYLYDGLADYAERLVATLPEPLDVCFFVNSGSEANELALRLARTVTGHQDILVVDGAYHGHTTQLIAISPYKFMGEGGRGQAEPWVHIVPVADGYRGPHKGQGLDSGTAYGDAVGRVIDEAGKPIAGFICESLLGCGGQVIPPEGYFETAYRHVRSAGGLCIADEVQVGFGRVGSHFWGFERQAVVPDIVVMGKPIGNGHPMAAVVTTREIADAFANGMEFFSTFGGNPVSCAIGLAVLDVIRDEGLQEHALAVGTRLRDGLRSLMEKHELIGDVRGVGLFIGVELVRDRETLEPAATEAANLVNRLKDRGLLLSTDGPLQNVIKIKPPMVLTAEDVEMTIRLFDDELSMP